MELVKITKPLGGKPMGSILQVTAATAEQLIASGNAMPVGK